MTLSCCSMGRRGAWGTTGPSPARVPLGRLPIETHACAMLRGTGSPVNRCLHPASSCHRRGSKAALPPCPLSSLTGRCLFDESHARPSRHGRQLKTVSSERVVPLHPAALDAITEWSDSHWIHAVGRAPRPDDFVFVRPANTRYL